MTITILFLCGPAFSLFQRYGGRFRMAESTDLLPDYFQLRRAIWVRASQKGVRRHPIIVRRNSLLSREEGEDRCQVMINGREGKPLITRCLPRLYMLIPWPGGRQSISPRSVKQSPSLAPHMILLPGGHTISTRRSYSLNSSDFPKLEAMVV